MAIRSLSFVQFEADVELWFAREGSVPIRDQLATQLILAIASGELPARKRLPSTRALAKRYRLNANTVSAAYQQLESLGWVESIRGSGVYVRAEQSHPGEAQLKALDRLVLPFLRTARATGLSAKEVRQRIDHWLGMRPNRFVFVHPDPALRAIICHELRRAMTWTIEECGPNPAAVARYLPDAIFLSIPSKHANVCSVVPPGSDVVALQVQQVDRALAGYLPIRPEVLMIVVSAWPGFLDIARTMLTAAGCDPDSVVFRHTSTRGWARGLGTSSAVVCDALTSASVPHGVRKIVFDLVSDLSIATLKTYEQFFRD